MGEIHDDGPTPATGRGVIRSIALWLGIVAAAAIAVPVLARLTGFEAGPLVLLVSLMPWVTIACVVPLAFAALARSWKLAVVAGALTVVCVAWLSPLFTGGGDGAEPSLRVATINATLGGADAQAIVDLVRDNRVDVLAVEELSPDEVAALAAAGLDDVLPFNAVFAEPGVTGTGLWSHYPLADVVSLPGFVSRAVRATIATDAGPLTFFAVHPAAPGMRHHDSWSADMALLHDVLDAVDGAVVVAGDFNTTRDHRPFRDIERLGYADGADQAGAGFMPTFPQGRGTPPFVAIDHVMTRGGNLIAMGARTVVIPGADHRALVVTYAAK